MIEITERRTTVNTEYHIYDVKKTICKIFKNLDIS